MNVMHLYLITYDVNVTSDTGALRLRRVAKACESRGRRVQQSVFECHLTTTHLEELRQKLVSIIDLKLDSLRIYALRGDRDDAMEVYGLDQGLHYMDPLVF